jgi:uncharacterized membrane protein YjgN (DUF898 family)
MMEAVMTDPGPLSASAVPASGPDLGVHLGPAHAVLLPQPAGASGPQITRYAFVFTGQAAEYFRIWIVNVALTILTLGLFTAWARVRSRRYFYGHTWVAGHNFEYAADPRALLRGYLIAAGFFAAYLLSQNFSSLAWLTALLLLLFAGLYPWLTYRSLRFQAASTLHRGLGLRFHGRPRGAYAVYLWQMLLAALTLGLTYPLVVARQRRYALGQAAYGTAPVSFGGRTGQVYLIFLGGLMYALAAGIIIFGLGTVVNQTPLTRTVRGWLSGAIRLGLPLDSVLRLLGPAGALLLLGFVVGQYVRAGLLRWSTGELYIGRTLRLSTTISPLRLAWIGLSNLLLQIVTLGLLTPWTAVRRARYLSGHIALESVGDLDRFENDRQVSESALGEAASEIFSVEVGF